MLDCAALVAWIRSLTLACPLAVSAQYGSAVQSHRLALKTVAAAMEWTPSDKMTITDLRAVLASWDIATSAMTRPCSSRRSPGTTRDHAGAWSRRPAVPAFVSGLPVFAPVSHAAAAATTRASARTARARSAAISAPTSQPATTTTTSDNQHRPRPALIRDFEAAVLAKDRCESKPSSAACAAAADELPGESAAGARRSEETPDRECCLRRRRRPGRARPSSRPLHRAAQGPRAGGGGHREGEGGRRRKGEGQGEGQEGSREEQEASCSTATSRWPASSSTRTRRRATTRTTSTPELRRFPRATGCGDLSRGFP